MIKKNLYRTLLFSAMCIFCFIALSPILLMILNSLKSSQELAHNAWGFPQRWIVDNYRQLATYNSGIIVRTFCNSIFISITTTVFTLIISSLAAYSFAKFKFNGKNIIFIFLLCTMMVPAEITLPAIFLMFSKVGLLNSYVVQILPGIANVFCLFLLRQYMESIPDSLIEAARIDGAGYNLIYLRLMLPLVKPALGALAILTFLNKWNDYLWPSILLTKQEIMPIMVILPSLNVDSGAYMVPWNLTMAGCVLVTLPLVIVFLLFQDLFMSSITIGAIKE